MNPRPLECHSSALPTELHPHEGIFVCLKLRQLSTVLYKVYKNFYAHAGVARARTGLINPPTAGPRWHRTLSLREASARRLFYPPYDALGASTRRKKSRSRASLGLPKICSGGPSSTIKPWFIKATRSATSRAKAISWETTTMVMPSSAS